MAAGSGRSRRPRAPARSGARSRLDGRAARYVDLRAGCRGDHADDVDWHVGMSLGARLEIVAGMARLLRGGRLLRRRRERARIRAVEQLRRVVRGRNHAGLVQEVGRVLRVLRGRLVDRADALLRVVEPAVRDVGFELRALRPGPRTRADGCRPTGARRRRAAGNRWLARLPEAACSFAATKLSAGISPCAVVTGRAPCRNASVLTNGSHNDTASTEPFASALVASIGIRYAYLTESARKPACSSARSTSCWLHAPRHTAMVLPCRSATVRTGEFFGTRIATPSRLCRDTATTFTGARAPA